MASMTRRTCVTCGPESLFAGSVCCSCGHDLMAPKPQTKRRGWNGAVTRREAALRAPIAEDAGNLLSLMAAKT